MSIDLTSYSFLCVSANRNEGDVVAYNITDCDDADEFARRWIECDDALQQEFGYDLPTVWDNNCATIEDFTTDEAKDLTSHITEVRDVTFGEYVKLVQRKVAG